MSYFKSVLLDTDNAIGDAFGRLRISNPESLFDSKQINDNQPLFWDDQEISGSGTTSTHSTDLAASTITVAASTAGTRIRQTFQRFNYQPGKSQLILLTGVLDKTGGGADITRRIGLFDDDNGVFFEESNSNLSVGIRSHTSGSPVDTTVSQSSWNIDPLDGTGNSGLTLDISKTNIFIIDFEWLGVGRVRLGVNIDGKTYYCHEFLNANNLTTVYMSNPNLPLRFEISNGGTGVESSLDHNCTSVVSEGGSQDLGILRYASTEGTHVDAASENTMYAILGIRKKANYLNSIVKLVNFSLQIQTASHQAEWVLYFNPTIAGTFTYSDETNSAAQIATGSTLNTISTGTPIIGGFLQSASNAGGGAGSFSDTIENALLLGSSISGNPDEFVLGVRPIGGATDLDVEAGLTWRELS